MAKAKEEYWRDGPAKESARVHTDTAEDPGPDVSNADVDLGTLSQDSAFSTVQPATEQNPGDLRPAPGPQRVEVHGVAEDTDGPVSGQLEGTRNEGDGSGSKLEAAPGSGNAGGGSA